MTRDIILVIELEDDLAFKEHVFRCMEGSGWARSSRGGILGDGRTLVLPYPDGVFHIIIDENTNIQKIPSDIRELFDRDERILNVMVFQIYPQTIFQDCAHPQFD
jgi:hypothetical protein